MGEWHREMTDKRAIYMSKAEANALYIAIWTAIGSDAAVEGSTKKPHSWTTHNNEANSARAWLRVHLSHTRDRLVAAFPHLSEPCDLPDDGDAR